MRNLHSTLAALTVLISATAATAQRTPIMEFSEMLNGLDVRHHNASLEVEDANGYLTAVFLSPNTTVDLVITRAGSKTPLHVLPMDSSKTLGGVFSVIRPRVREFRFTEPGDYVATYRANRKPMTVVPFSVEFAKNEDEFNPLVHAYTNGPWSQWAYLFASVADGPQAEAKVYLWVRKKSFLPAPDADVYTLELRKDGDVVAEANKGFTNSKEWQKLGFNLRHPESKGGRTVTVKELVARDGTYDVVVKKNGVLHAVFQFKVKGGKPQLHPRQAADHSPRTEYIVPRFAGLGGSLGQGSQGHTVWMKRLPNAAAVAVASGKPAEVAGPSDEQRRRWNWIPNSIDPERPFRVVVTGIETRNDTGIAAGEDLIVFGTGFPTGVQYMKAGETKPREIPDGETYSSKVFQVCGKKIVLVKKEPRSDL